MAETDAPPRGHGSPGVACPQCRTPNPPGAKFCIECGSSLARRCAACGAEPPDHAKFCPACGRALAEPSPALSPAAASGPTRPAAAAPPSPHAERRQLTVLMCDLVESMPLAARLDPEELRDVVRAYQEACAAVIAGLDGHIAQYLGDGILVYFGYPEAHEDDPQRAVRAGLRIVEAVRRLNERIEPGHGVRLALHIGIHTGLVVAGEVGAGATREQLALGQTPNIAARLQSLTLPDQILISDATHRLIEGFFDCRSLGPQPIKGLSEPLVIFQVVAESTARTRLEALSPTNLSPFVGRQSELALLRERWSQASAGRGQIVLVAGEPGIGKSRLVQTLKEDVARDPAAWLTPMQCSPYHQQSALYPVVDLFERVVFRFDPDTPPEQKRRVLEGWLAQYHFDQADTVPLFCDLLGIPLESDAAAGSAADRRMRLLTALQAVVLKIADRQPLLLVVEDLHWADPTTLELLGLLHDQLSAIACLAVYTARPEFTPPWPSRTHVTQLALPRLVPADTSELVTHVTRDRALPSAVVEQIVAKTDGVPLFVEELTKSVLESGLLREVDGRYELAGPLPPLGIPTTVQDSLLARLDRLATARTIAQLAACVGREFSYELLRAVAPLDEPTLQRELARLVDAELLYQRGLPPDAGYLFKHALVQDAAYESLLKSTRQQHHQRIARALVERFPAIAQAQPELVAHHYDAAGLAIEAAPWWLRSAQHALSRYANAEAASHAQRGLDQLARVAESPERDRLELSLQSVLGIALMTTRGFSYAAAGAAYSRARALARQLGVPSGPELSSILYGLWANQLVLGDVREAFALGQELFAATVDDDPVRLVAHRMLAYPQMLWGAPTAARDEAERIRAAYDPVLHYPLATPFGQDPGMSALGYGSLCWWLTGFPDTAVARSEEAFAGLRAAG